MHQPRISHLETAVSIAIEMGEILRDPVRYNSEEWHQVVRKRQEFNRYLQALGIDRRIVDYRVKSIPEAMYGENKFAMYTEGTDLTRPATPVAPVVAELPLPVYALIDEPVVLADQLAA